MRQKHCAIRPHVPAGLGFRQRQATKEAQRAGIEHAKANGDGYRGRRPTYSHKQLTIVKDMLGQNAGISEIAKVSGLSRQTIYRIKDDPAAVEAALAVWDKAAA